jgi:hypothetical protein
MNHRHHHPSWRSYFNAATLCAQSTFKSKATIAMVRPRTSVGIQPQIALYTIVLGVTCAAGTYICDL